MNPSDSSLVDLEITKDQGSENYCLKAGSAKIKDENNGRCKVLSVKIEPGHFDCG